MCLSNVVFDEDHFKLLQTKRETKKVKNLQYAVLSLYRYLNLTILFIALELINNVDIPWHWYSDFFQFSRASTLTFKQCCFNIYCVQFIGFIVTYMYIDLNFSTSFSHLYFFEVMICLLDDVMGDLF